MERERKRHSTSFGETKKIILFLLGACVCTACLEIKPKHFSPNIVIMCLLKQKIKIRTHENFSDYILPPSDVVVDAKPFRKKKQFVTKRIFC